VFGHAAHDHGIGHRLDDAQAVDAARNPDGETLARELVDQRHQPYFAAIVSLCFDKVVGPDVIAMLWSEPNAGPVVEPQSASWLLFLRDFQPLAAPDPLHPVGADLPACLVEQLGDPAIAIAAVLDRKSQDGLSQCVFISSNNQVVTLGAPWLANEPAGMTLGELILLPNARNRLPASFGAYKFPEAMSFNTCFSSDRSATSRFSRTFSFSRSFIFRA
jgi:hypothetical protein